MPFARTRYFQCIVGANGHSPLLTHPTGLVSGLNAPRLIPTWLFEPTSDRRCSFESYTLILSLTGKNLSLAFLEGFAFRFALSRGFLDQGNAFGGDRLNTESNERMTLTPDLDPRRCFRCA
ncbi:MAG: hypothetical protein QQW96_15185 [Tychonema bourrellyi B0820]|nr:hypothetical protein [Tychonema bourrellyi B0820]